MSEQECPDKYESPASQEMQELGPAGAEVCNAELASAQNPKP